MIVSSKYIYFHFQTMSPFYIGIIVSGGNDAAQKSVEILREDGTSCTLPNLTENRKSHSQSGWVICGGYENPGRQTCTTFKDGAWVNSHNLTVGRWDHLSCKTPEGDILLMGGGSTTDTRKTTELVSARSSTTVSKFSFSGTRLVENCSCEAQGKGRA